MSMLVDKELEKYRDLVKAPGTFEDGFGWKALMGSIFVAVVMLPAAMYMALAIGESIGPAAKWVTVLLFIEMAKRARSVLRPSEIFILFALVGTLTNGPMEGMFFRQFLVQSEAARSFGLSDAFPAWYAPTSTAVLDQRNFFMWEWFAPIALICASVVIARIDSLILGYGLFRVTSDIEKLPFPMAPIGVAGVTALSENQSGTEGWRWRCFSIGAMLGLLGGFLYAALPIMSNALGMTEPFKIFPIPFLDTTSNTEHLFPAGPTGISFEPSGFFVGMAMPFFGVVGTLIGVVGTLFLNGGLQHFGLLPNWSPGMGAINTTFSNQMDFYLSFGIGLALAVALIGFWQVFRSLRDRKQATIDAAVAVKRVEVNRTGRGDIRTWIVIATYIASSCFYILLSGWLLDWDFRGSHLLWVLLFFAFVYTPVISYVTARLEGLAGQMINIPYIREAAFILSGYKGIEVWLLPLPLHNYGAHDMVQYRTAELIGCSFRSIWKATAISIPLIILLSLLYAQFIWSLGPIPSQSYPFAMTFWELNARNTCLVYSSTLSGYSPFLEALNPMYIAAGGGLGLLIFTSLSAFGAPVLLFYGMVGGLGQAPFGIISTFSGALFGRFVMAPRFGETTWRQYAPVLMAGFSCGMGLIMMLAVGMKFLSAAVFQLPY